MSTSTAPARGLRGHTPPILGADGAPHPGSIATLERLQLGDARQWVLIRGRDTANPVLLFLAGGPGGSEIDQLRRHSGRLEEAFTVVGWEQRGTGKSLAAGYPRTTMTIRQLTDDALELVGHLRQRFGQRKIFLVGHSLGTVLAVRMVQDRPEWFHAYVGIGQLVNPTENDRLTWQFTLDGAVRRGERRAAARLRRYGPPPYRGWRMLPRYALLNRLGSRYLHEDRGTPGLRLAAGSATSEFTWLDRLRCCVGLARTFRAIYPRLQQLDLIAQAPRLDVPVYLVTGTSITSDSRLIERYHDALTAPSKALVPFPDSGHAPCFDEPGRFNEWLIEQVLPHATAQRSTPAPG